MGNLKLKWNSDEEKALLAGIEKHGTGKWKSILQDPQFSPFLTHRSNVDLKDKWRNMRVGSGQGSRDRSRSSRSKNNKSNAEISVPNSVPRIDSSAFTVEDYPPKSPEDELNAERYIGMIFEALSMVNGANGSEIGAILSFIEQKEEFPLPPNFRKTVGTMLGRLVLQSKLEKLENGYKIKAETPAQKELNEVNPHKPQTPLQVAAENAAYRIAKAEDRLFLAAKTIKEAERLEEMAEECDLVIKLAEELCAQFAGSESEICFYT